MANIEKYGVIPASSALVYDENFRLSDDSVGKFISLVGPKTFYNPGIGVGLSVPNLATVTTVKEFKSINAGDTRAASAVGLNMASFLFFPTNTVIINTLASVGTTNSSIQMIPVGARNMSDLTTFIPTGNPVYIKALEAGVYNVYFYSKGTVTKTVSNGGFQCWNQFFIRIKGVETALNSVIIAGSPGGSARPQTASFSFEVTYNQAVTLSVGDIIEVYGKSNAVGFDGATHTTTMTTTNTNCVVNISSTTSPTQTYFTNPLGITDLNINSINYYGASRDTLKLIGTQLTS